MKKLGIKDVAILTICFLVWTGSLIALFFIRHWSVLFVALLHCATIWFSFSKYGKYIPTRSKKTQAELEKVSAEYNARKAAEKRYENEYTAWDILDE